MKTKSLWEQASDYAAQTQTGMEGVFTFLAAIHPTTKESERELTECWERYNEQMESWAKTMDLAVC